jgi:hypothetical protein
VPDRLVTHAEGKQQDPETARLRSGPAPIPPVAMVGGEAVPVQTFLRRPGRGLDRDRLPAKTSTFSPLPPAGRQRKNTKPLTRDGLLIEAPQSGFSRLIVRINARTSLGTAGRPGLPCRTFQAQNKRKPIRCQPITVPALTIKTLDCQSRQTAHRQAHSHRSAGVSLGRLTDRWRTPS